jgi:hypothetical protein
VQVASEGEPRRYIAPSLGWVSSANLAAAPAGAANTLENWFPTSTGIRLRRGYILHATVDTTPDPVESLMAYVSGSDRQMFAASGGAVYDITSVADPEVPPAADISGLTSNYFSFQNFAASGGNTMTIANGTDTVRQYDGAAWSAPSITNLGPTGASTDTSVLQHVWAYSERLWFIEKNTMRAYCLPAGSIAGAATLVNLAGVFHKGGSLLSGATWSLDAGDGLDDKICFFSTEGEVAVYQGTDPGDTTRWRKVGVYDMAPPLGKRAYTQFGGQLLVATEEGLIPVSSAIDDDESLGSFNAASANIDPDWHTDAAARRGLPWEIVKWPSRNYVYVTTPVTGTSTPAWCYCANSEGWRWSKNTAWDMRCAVLHDDVVYFGTNDGTIMQADIGGYDEDAIFTGNAVLSFDPIQGDYKTVKQARALFRTANEIEPRLSVSSDYVVSLPTAPNVAAISGSPGVWDVGLWDDALWDVGDQYITYNTRWVSIGQSADFAFAPQVQISSGQAVASIVELVELTLTYESGGLVV